MQLTRLDRTSRHLASALITTYQRKISPHKGFSCAHRVLYGGESCSQYIKRVILEDGILLGWSKARQRFQDCRSAKEKIQARRLKLLQITQGIPPATPERLQAHRLGALTMTEGIPEPDPELTPENPDEVLEPELPPETKDPQPVDPESAARSTGVDSCNTPALDCADISCDLADCAGDFSTLDCSGLDCSGLDCSGLDCSGLDCSGLDCSGLDCSGCDVGSCG